MPESGNWIFFIHLKKKIILKIFRLNHINEFQRLSEIKLAWS